MMSTLLKYEWLRTRAMIGAITAIVALIVLVGSLLTVTGWPVVATAGLSLGIFAALALVPVLQIALAVDYWLSSYRRMGYFTHALPIRGSKIYAAKLTWVLLVTVAALIVTLAFAAVLWAAFAVPMGLEANPLVVIGEFLTQAGELLSPWLLVAVGLLLVVMFLIWPVQYYFAASVGSETPLNRYGAGGPVIMFVGLYVVTQIVVMAGMLLVPVGIGAVGDGLGLVPVDLVGDMVAGTETNDVMPLGFIPPLILITAVCLWRSVRSWNRKVTLV